MFVASSSLVCRFCGQPHAPAAVRRGQRLLCTRCGITLIRRSWFGPQAPLAFALAALVLAVPALVLPFATVSKIGAPRTGWLLDGAVAFWDHRLPFLAGWVGISAAAAPLLLASALVVRAAAARHRPENRLGSLATRVARALDAWAMPEVYVLAVLVAFVRIGLLADVRVGPGFWCYVAMTLALLLASRGFRLDPDAVR